MLIVFKFNFNLFSKCNTYFKGQLIQFLNSKPQLTLKLCLQIFGQSCKAVAHMHKQNPAIIHRDLKVNNVCYNLPIILFLKWISIYRTHS